VRGCLFILVLGAALLAVVAWFGALPLTRTLVDAGLSGSGFRAAQQTVTVTSDPPVGVLAGHADIILIDATDVTWRTLQASRVTLELDDVDLFGRTARTIHGRIDNARIGSEGSADSSIPLSMVDFDGPTGAADASITVEATVVRGLVIAAVQREFGVKASDLELLSPDRIRLTAPGATIDATLVIDGSGALAISTSLGSVEMFRVDPAIPLRLRSATVVDGSLRLDGILDVTDLLRG
jgi:hypothetical protein